MQSAMSSRSDTGQQRTDQNRSRLNFQKTDPGEQNKDQYKPRLNIQKYVEGAFKELQELKERRDDINKEIFELNEEKKNLHVDLAGVTSKLSKLNESLFSKSVHIGELNQLETDYNRTLSKLIEGSELLLRSMSRATVEIERQHTAKTSKTF
ncbi:unnamed protein product [Mytilus coruscus]|uniref:Uncharacterized protein n=1 Tax=Mytilus coruscus TaxID=42192 RepID=A0A6J7ZXM8_MYTCO|nr:unnamed protein product [Mytilus coruscus]